MTTKTKTKSKPAKSHTAAVLTIYDADDMAPRDHGRIAEWLRARADDLEQYGDQLEGKFVARYIWTPRGTGRAKERK